VIVGGVLALGRHTWLAAGLVAMVVLAGCRDESTADRTRGPATQTDAKGGLFESVAENLDHLEQFETEQILKQVCDRLNQWNLQEKPTVAWQPDPLLKGLGDEASKAADPGRLERVRFQDPDDAWFLQEAVWLRNISNVARADQFQELAVAERLFDWTVRNIQLEDDSKVGDKSGLRHWPFETLLYGRGTALERAWVFILLARQQGLDVVMLGLADAEGKSVRPWLPALVLGDDLYLFDCQLGLPVPGPTPGSVATLAQVVADDTLLRRLDLAKDHRYPVTADDLKHVVAYVEGSPAGLSHRMALVESRLTGKHKMKLTSPGSSLAERVEKLPHVAEVKLWPVPFEVALAKAGRSAEEQREALREMVIYQAMPVLRRGRASHFKGEYEGEQGAKALYLNARPPEKYLEDYKLPKEIAERFPPETHARVEAGQILMMRAGKQNASYWIGLIFFEQGDYPNAIDFLDKRTLAAPHKSPWTTAATYNLARTYEADGQLDKAIELYESDKSGPQSHGNRLRARWLKEKSNAAKDDKADSAASPSATPAEKAE
jgi:tetratricopeptide (TPR) repeat protein